MLTTTPKSSAIVEIERLGFSWHEEPSYELSQLSPDRRVQVRDSEHYAPKAQVAQYAVQMKETAFPPILVTSNGWTVDGSTRVGAKHLNKDKFIHAIVLAVEYGKSAKVDAELHALAATLNQQGGLRLTTQEMKGVALRLVKLGWKNESINRAVGVKTGLVNNIKREVAAQAKFDRVGFKNAAKLGPSSLRSFGMEPVLGLNDVPFKKLVELAVEANLGPAEIKELADDMKKTGSDAGMIKHVDAKKAEMSDRIREHALLGNGKPPASSQLRRHLGFITGHAAQPTALVERSPAAMAEHLRVMEEAVQILEVAITAQEKLLDD
jgi:hypothetical protein